LFFKSIRFRLTLWYAVTLAVILFLFSSILYATFRDLLYREVDGELLAIAEPLASQTLAPFRDSSPSAFDQVLEDFLGAKARGKSVRFLDAAGKVGAHSTNLDNLKLSVRPDDFRQAILGNSVYSTETYQGDVPVRVISYPIFENNNFKGVVQVGSALDEAQDYLSKILTVLAISIPLALILFSCGGWFLASRALKPVDLITRTARKISAENLSQRLEVVNPNDEIGRLAQTFNTTLTKLESSFVRARQFSADVSHELRTPLTILRGETEMGLKCTSDPAEFRLLLQSNLEEINRMSGIIEYLLELSRAEAGVLALDLKELDLKELLAEQVQTVGVLAQEKQVNLVFEESRPVIVRADKMRLRQIFVNLLDNAVKYTPAGGDARLILEREGSWAKVSVRDTGKGITAESLPRIFDRFYRVDEARNRAHGGTGLGLSLVKSFVEAHGGMIDVSSVPGKGSLFVVYLPLPTNS
jgi:heavy metal sensor kinase